jgi:tetraacyldisaccharide 4'-kinase
MARSQRDNRPYVERVITGDERGPISWLIRGGLLGWALVYSLGLAVYLWGYRVGIKRRVRLPVTVVSVGNLSFGGTGKTPAVIALARALVDSGRRVVILSRGHGGSADGPRVVSDGKQLMGIGSQEAGDEPVMLALSLPGVPVLVGRDRRVTGAMACEEFIPDVIILDDGMQYWQLYRDVEIAVVDALRPFGSGFVMPAGDLREPRSGLARANYILLTNADCVEPDRMLSLKATLGRLAPDAQLHDCVRVLDGFVSAVGSSDKRLPVKGEKVLSFCGIGRPESFERALKSLGVDTLDSLVFPDHWAYREVDLRRIESRRMELDVQTVVTTEKDLARIDSHAVTGLCALRVRLEVDRIGELAEHIAHRTD